MNGWKKKLTKPRRKWKYLLFVHEFTEKDLPNLVILCHFIYVFLDYAGNNLSKDQ